MTGQGDIFAREQKYKNGNVQRSYLKFVVVNEKSTNFFQPAIPAQKVFSGVKEDVKKALKSEQLKKRSPWILRIESKNYSVKKKMNLYK
ncbi:hypothetical protein LEP1GSC133_0650 [Leptospira borgpetersenii serovar Pomona str. 200901868]|uniref:Uncharacterized protein n=1 Tax=Leptospira borgpetersenii serovar Pomona str. 200901868 TaxID=1192866 RepID=M6WHW8_LEPBO|nr:hypothetical protein LEP1GSC133_0650 [Leptospira borgpetersenii serovar Pomona str. 200901868]